MPVMAKPIVVFFNYVFVLLLSINCYVKEVLFKFDSRIFYS